MQKGISPCWVGNQAFRLDTLLPQDQRTISALSDIDQRSLLEEIVELLRTQPKGCDTMVRLLRTSMILHASP